MRPTTATAPRDSLALVAPLVTRQVNAERIVLLGWGRAILLQLAHPLIAAGVYEHSAFRASPWTAVSRLHATIHAMLSLTFGTEARREAAIDGIRSIHRRVNGRLAEAVGPFAAGTPYSAEDPALVEWVHLTLLESVPMVYELVAGTLTAAQRDAYCEEAAGVALALGARPGEVPRQWREVEERIRERVASGAIVVGPQARELAPLVVSPALGRLLPPAGWVNRLITVGLMPAGLRAEYGFTWNARRQRALERVIPAVRALRRGLPDRIALWPEART